MACTWTMGQPISGTRTVGTGGDYATIQAAVNDLAAKGVSGNVTIKIKPGLYKEMVTINTIPGSGPSSTVKLTSESGNRNDVVVYSENVAGMVFYLYSVQGVILEKLSIRNMGHTSGHGIGLSSNEGVPCDFNVVRDCHIALDSTLGTSSASGIRVFYSTPLYPNNVWANNNIFENNLIEGGARGVSLSFFSIWSAGTNNQVLYNVIRGQESGGISTFYGDGYKFVGNYIRVKKTLSQRSKASGIWYYYSTNGFIANNMIAGDFSSIKDESQGIYINIAERLKVLNNSIYMNGSPTVRNTAIQITGSVNDLEVKNNIFCNVGGGYAFWSDKQWEAAPDYLVDYNCLYTNGPYIARWGSADFPTLSHLKTGTQNLKDANSISVLPLFKSVTDLHTENPALNGKGTPHLQVTQDIDKENRDPNTPDIGADEFTPLDLDVAVLGISPKGSPQQGKPIVLEATLRNEGVQSLNGKSISVSYSSDSGKTWSATEVLTPSTLAGYYSTQTFEFSAPWTPSRSGRVELRARVFPALSGETRTTNNMARSEICIAAGGLYTVGAAEADFTSISQAIQFVYSCGFTSDLEIRVNPGLYLERLVIPYIPQAQGSHALLIRGMGQDPSEVIIRDEGAGQSNDHAVVRLLGSRNVTLKNLTVQCTRAEGKASGIQLTAGADSNTLDQVHVKMDTTGKSQELFGILASSADKFMDKDLNASNTLVINCLIKGGYYGIRFYGSAENPKLNLNNRVVQTRVQSTYYHGISMEFQTSPLIKANTVIGPTYVGANAAGILVTDLAKGDFEVSGNTLLGAWQWGISVNNSVGEYEPIIANNMLPLDKTLHPFRAGIKLFNSARMSLYFNSVRAENDSAAALFVDGTTGYDYIFKNNIFMAKGGWAIFLKTNSSVLECNYNDLYSTGTDRLTYWGSGGNMKDLETHQLYTAHDGKSISVNPIFMGFEDLHASSPALDKAGQRIHRITKDFDGELRDTLAPDIGADEFVSGLDLLPDSILSPGASLNWKSGQSIEVKARIRNSGTVNVTNIPVAYRVNTGDWVSETFSTLINPGGTKNITFGQRWTPSDSGTFDLCVVTNLSGDLKPGNDTICRKINIKLDPDSTIGVEPDLNAGMIYSIYPNPLPSPRQKLCVSGLDTEPATQGITLRLSNLQGQEVYRARLREGDACVSVPQGIMGTFIVTITNAQKTTQYKLFIQ